VSPHVSRVAIAGAGGMGRETLAWLREARPGLEAVAFFTADNGERPSGADVDLPVMTSIDELAADGVDGVVLGIGDGARRRKVADEVEAAGLTLVTVVHPSALLGPGVTLGGGCIVAPGSVLTRDVQLGRGAIVNYGANVGHDCVIGDFAFVGPGAVLTGDVRVGADSLVGAGAVILPGRSVGSGAVVGAGAVVTQDVGDGSTVAGVPARSHGLNGGHR
jgi:sugar O-acyltransferase (sialic acid O-acetyltransferase NeuD family)